IGRLQFPADGFFGVQITGEGTLYFAAPSGNGPIGNSQRYQIYFTPSASTTTFRWINWGHYSGPNGLSDELVLDDVILNEVPEPSAIGIMLTMGICAVVWKRRVHRARQPQRVFAGI